MKTLLIAALVLLLGACSGSSQPDASQPAASPAAESASTATDKAPASHVPEHIQTLRGYEDRARNVENVLQKADQKRRQQLQQASGGDNG